MKLLNLGCGRWCHPKWTNVDFTSTGDGVIAHNLLKGIPFADNTFDVVYHSHVLEHFSKEEGEIFIKECFRVLKKNGIIRIAVPDLEQIAREYIKNLEKACLGDEYASLNYDWILLELYDQTLREVTQGGMGRYWYRLDIPNEEYVASRMGAEFIEIRKSLIKNNINSPVNKKKVSTIARICYYFKWSTYLNKIRRILLGKEYTYYEIGKFRSSGEVHKWMYDKFSLSRLLANTGFSNIKIVNAHESIINNWYEFGLDVDKGKVRKPDSLFMEAIK